jgi:hypothetical protein
MRHCPPKRHECRAPSGRRTGKQGQKADPRQFSLTKNGHEPGAPGGWVFLVPGLTVGELSRVPQVSLGLRDLGGPPRSPLVTDRPSLIVFRSIHDRGLASMLSTPVRAFRLGLVRSLLGSGGSAVATAPRSRKDGETWGTLTSGTPTHHERFWHRSSLVTDRPSLIFLLSIHDRGPTPILWR